MIKLTISGDLTLDGVVSANGDNSHYSGSGAGSGGSVNITAGRLRGLGAINANGGYGYPGSGGGGRIAIATPDNVFTGTVTAYGVGGYTGAGGGAGTVFVNGVLTIDNNNTTYLGYTTVNWDYTVSDISSIIVRSRAIVEFSSSAVIGSALEVSTATVSINDSLTIGALSVNYGGVISPNGHKADLTVNGDLAVRSGGSINANKKGYASGEGPGKGKDGQLTYSAGGGSYGGISSGSDGPTYGSVVNPMDLGSGGGIDLLSTYPGGAGGGLIKLDVSGDLKVDGGITANGEDGHLGQGGAGAGGSINITAGRLIGSGEISANGNIGYNRGNGGGGGRIAISAPYNVFTGTVTAYGESGGGAGTVFVNGILTIDNNNTTYLGYTTVSGSYTVSDISSIIVRKAIVEFSTSAVIGGTLEINTATVTINDSLTIGALSVNYGGVISPKGHKADLTVNGDLSVRSGGSINVDKKGYASGEGPGKGKDGQLTYSAGGGSYGGIGGASDGPTYGSLINPLDWGSGGGRKIDILGTHQGGAGGGLIKLDVSGDLTVDGVITANGEDGRNGGAGAGGGINITAGGISGCGAISANGNYGYGYSGGGGGGRIALYYSQKTLTGAVTAAGGGSSYSLPGDKGSIVDNGAIISGGTLISGQSITAPAQTMGSQRSFTETVREENVSFNNLAASGTFSGTVNFTQMTFVKIKSGAYADKGFARGMLDATLEEVSYSGSFEGVIFVQGSTMSLKGVVSGDMRGSLELELTESAPGSGVYDKVSGLINCNHIGENVLAKLYVSGDAAYGQARDYPPTRLNLTQTAAQGDMTGGYAGPFNTIFTSLTIDDAANPYNGEGYSITSYSTNKGEAPGWAYAKRLQSGVVNLTGLLDYPLYALMEGRFVVNASTPTLLLDTEKLDNSLLALKLKTTHPDSISPGGTYSYAIEAKNQGTATLENISIVMAAPPHMAFVSASSSYTFHSAVYWTNNNYDPVSYIRWDFPQITPGQVINLSCQLKARIGVISDGEVMTGQVYALPMENALEFLPGYNYEGPMDDDVIEASDLPDAGNGNVITLQ